MSLSPTFPSGAAAGGHPGVATVTGQLVPVPAQMAPDVWAAFAREVVIVDGGCHLWLGRLQGSTGYGEFSYRLSRNVRVTTGAHRFAYAAFADLPAEPRRRRRQPPQDSVLPLPGLPPVVTVENDDDDILDVRHFCDEPLCAPVTAEAAAAHLITGDAVDNALDRERRGRGGRRRHGVRRLSADIRDRRVRSLAVQDAVRTALACGVAPAGLLAVIDEVYRDGDPMREQVSLPNMPPSRRLRIVR